MNYFFVVLIALVLVGCGLEDWEVNGRVDLSDTLVSWVSIDSLVSDCSFTGRERSLEIMTWNLKEFPLDNDLTVNWVGAYLLDAQIDIVALQEVKSTTALDKLLALLPGWKVVVVDGRGTIQVGFLYNSNAVELTSSILLFADRKFSSPFPRIPLLADFRHFESEIELKLLNVHLKCCSGEKNEERRMEAAKLLHQWSVVNDAAGNNLVILGDFNEELKSQNGMGFFIKDTLRYALNVGEVEGYSYPSYSSTIDHIVVSKKINKRRTQTQILSLDSCNDKYYELVSDHRPVLTVFE